MSRNLIIDCFAGGGGASVGIEMALGRPVDIAINHDPDAILMHKTNHPDTLHLTEDIFKVDLKRYIKGQHVALMWASPDCTSHSKAKGGKPRERGLRILPWAVYKHAKAILPDAIMMENVEEIQQWGPLDADGHPIKERRGEDYQKFITAMKSLGYIFDCRELIAAGYGAPTTRKRWYAIFRRDGREIVWPAPTHFKDREPRWKACGDYIDWSDLGRSIFDRSKPLADATMKRIANGIRKYIVDNSSPYIVRNKEAVAFLIQYHGETKAGDSRGQFLAEPIKTIDTSNRYGLVTAFVTKFYKSGIGQGCDEPLHTITTSPGHFGLISAFLIKYYGSGGSCQVRLLLAHGAKPGIERRAEMERLTREETIIVGGKEMAACNYKNNDCNDGCMYGRCRWQDKANMLLKEYEDTGLAPEQIRELKERDTGVKPMFSDGWDMCGNCGEHLMTDDNFCSECGQKIKWEE